jgi:hypothetical protein
MEFTTANVFGGYTITGKKHMVLSLPALLNPS